jgi:hypothetical protein
MNTKRSRPFTRNPLFALALLIVVIFAFGIENKIAETHALAPMPAQNAQGIQVELAPAGAAPEAAHYLEAQFCRESLCEGGNWEAWIILTPDGQWTIEELEQVRVTLLTTIRALDEAGFDGHALLSGYRFSRFNGEYIDGVEGRIARIYHDSEEIALADTAFMRLWGWYPYHELGHAIDRRLNSEPRRLFHEAAGSTSAPGSEQTADGYWLNEHARFDFGESAADAIALWIVTGCTDNPKPVFWLMPNDSDYETIAQTMGTILNELGGS